MRNNINIMFAVTPDYLKYATVTAMSAVKNLKNEKINIHFLYADIYNKISSINIFNYTESIKNTFCNKNINIYFYDCSSMIQILDGQNMGMWGEISLSHYLYFLAEKLIDAEKVIYLDTDTIVNCNISNIYNIDIKDNVVAMAKPSGLESMGKDVSNAGVVMINLKKWKNEKILDDILKFGKTLKKSNFCAQALLHYYLKGRNLIYYFDAEYNIFPHMYIEKDISSMKILHYTGYTHCRPWRDIDHCQRGSDLWWKYARETPFYEDFIYDIIDRKIDECILTTTLKYKLKKKFHKLVKIYRYIKKFYK